MPNIVVMDPRIILEEINAYSRRSGLKVSTICQMAFRNAKYFDRLSARVERLNEERARLREFIETHLAEPAVAEASIQRQGPQTPEDAA